MLTKGHLGIFQMRLIPETENLRYQDYHAGDDIPLQYYDFVYGEGFEEEPGLEAVFARFNGGNRPNRTEARALSVSDIVVIRKFDEKLPRAYCCRAFGWQDISGIFAAKLVKNHPYAPGYATMTKYMESLAATSRTALWEQEALFDAATQYMRQIINASRKKESWLDVVRGPLLDELIKASGKKHGEVLGPQGLGNDMYVSLFDDDRSAAIWLNLRPNIQEDGSVWFNYVTDHEIMHYENNSVGFLNRLGYETKPLPDDVHEILKLFK